jgi:hypothetical protein
MTADFPHIDFDRYHREELPRLLADGRGSMAGPAALRLGPLAFRLPEGGAYTYLPDAEGVEVRAGDADADTVIEIAAADWQGIVHELDTAPGLLYASRVRCVRGDPLKFVGWEPGLRAMYNGRPIFDPATAQLADRDGTPLDPTRSFRRDDPEEEMAHFLRTAGFLFVRGVFGADEVAAFRSCADALREEAVAGDRESWWGRNARGEEVLCRVTRAGSQPALHSLARDERILRLVALADEPLTLMGARGVDDASVIYKNPEMDGGLSDLPWHRDCGMGGHAVTCPILIASVFLTRASPETGELRMLPGSWTGSCGYIDANNPKAPRGVAPQAEPGDVTLHYGDCMHAAPPPTRHDLDSYRISAVMAYARKGARNHRGKGAYNEVLLSRDDGQIEHLADVVKQRSR